MNMTTFRQFSTKSSVQLKIQEISEKKRIRSRMVDQKEGLSQQKRNSCFQIIIFPQLSNWDNFFSSLEIYRKMASKATAVNLPLLKQEIEVSVYVRNYAKKAVMLVLPSKIGMDDFRERITRKMKVSQQNQALFLHGTLIPNNLKEIQLRNQLIFHLVNLKRVYLSQITISVKRIEPNRPAYRFTVPSQMRISDFLKNAFQEKFSAAQDYFLVYTGRELNIAKTFAEEFVEDQSQIMAVHKKQNLKSEYVELRRLATNHFQNRGPKNMVLAKKNDQQNSIKNLMKSELSEIPSAKREFSQDFSIPQNTRNSSKQTSKQEIREEIMEKQQKMQDLIKGGMVLLGDSASLGVEEIREQILDEYLRFLSEK